MRAVTVNTTQNVRLDYEIASVGERILATILDYFIYLGWFVLCSIFSDLFSIQLTRLTFVTILLPVLFYHLACEIFFNGQSIGKRTLKIRVLKKDGSQPSIGDYLLRWLFRIIDCGIGSGSVAIIFILFNGKGQRLGDIAAGTTVVRTYRRTSLEDIRIKEAPPDYVASYPEALALSDKDIATIRRILKKSTDSGKIEMLDPLSEKVGGIMGITPDREPYAFLTTVLDDYHFLVNSSSPPNRIG